MKLFVVYRLHVICVSVYCLIFKLLVVLSRHPNGVTVLLSVSMNACFALSVLITSETDG